MCFVGIGIGICSRIRPDLQGRIQVFDLSDHLREGAVSAPKHVQQLSTERLASATDRRYGGELEGYGTTQRTQAVVKL